MEIVKAFENVTIQGSQEPLFRATDIGAILGLTNIHATIKDFDNTEKVINSIYTPGGQQEVTFLTEFGLYEILFRSRKPIAKQFKKWVCEVIKEIRLNENYQLKKQIEEKDLQLEQQQKIITEKEIKNEEIITNKEKVLLTNFSKKPIVYIGLAESNIAKFGYTDDLETRIKDHKREINKFFTFEHVFECKLNRELEKKIKIHPILRQKRISKEYNDKNQTELFLLDADFTIDKLYEIIIEIRKELETDILKEKDQKIQKLEKQIRKDIPFIARNITSKEEIIFKTYSDAHNIARIGPHSIKDNYLNKPIQCRGWTFREQGMPYWEPPKNFIFNPEQKPSTHMEFCKSINKKTGEIIYYNSNTEATWYMNKLDPENFPINDTNKRIITHVIQGRKTTKVPLIYYNWSKIEKCGHWVYPDGHKEEI